MSNNKKKDPDGITREDAEKIFESQVNEPGTFINTFYAKILETSHPATKEIVKKQLTDGLMMGFQIRDMLQETEANPEKKKAALAKLRAMQNQMNSSVITPAESLRKDNQKEKKDK